MDKQTISFYLATAEEQNKIVKVLADINAMGTTYGRIKSCVFDMGDYFVEVTNADVVLETHTDYIIYPAIRFGAVVDGKMYPKELAEKMREHIASGQLYGEFGYPPAINDKTLSVSERMSRYRQVDTSRISHRVVDLVVDQYDVGHLVVVPTGPNGEELRKQLGVTGRFGARSLCKMEQNQTQNVFDIITWDFFNVNRNGDDYKENFVDDMLNQRQLIDRVLAGDTTPYIKTGRRTVRLVPRDWEFPKVVVGDKEVFSPLFDARRRQLDMEESESNGEPFNPEGYVDYVPGTWGGPNDDCGYDFVLYETVTPGTPIGLEVDGELKYRWKSPLELAVTLKKATYFGTSYEVDPSRHFTLEDYIQWVQYEAQNSR